MFSTFAAVAGWALLASPAEVRLTNPLVKLRPTEPLPASAAAITTIAAGRWPLVHTPLRLQVHRTVRPGLTLLHLSAACAAQNEYESFQVVVVAPPSAPVEVVGIEAAFAGLDPDRTVLVHREHYIDLKVASNCAGGTGLWPDALIPDVDVYYHEKRNAFPAMVPAGQSQAFWVDVFVPNGTAPGPHPGAVTVAWAAAAGEDAAPPPPTELPLGLTVFGFALPSVSRYSTTYNCPISAIEAGRFLGSPPANVTHGDRIEWQKQYVDLGLMHRVTFSDFLGADPWSLGQDAPNQIDWGAVASNWSGYLGIDGATVDTPFGLTRTRPTTIQLPAINYPGPPATHAENKTLNALIDRLWHATGTCRCRKDLSCRAPCTLRSAQLSMCYGDKPFAPFADHIRRTAPDSPNDAHRSF